jgi:two-component system, NtrC family, sensor kinase
MKLVLYSAAMLLMALGYPKEEFAQGIDEDSLQREILKSLDRQLDAHKFPKNFFDTSKIPSSSYLPLDFKKLFEGINKEIAAARSAGDIGNVTKGYGKLSTLDSLRGNYKGAYENYKLYAAYRDSLQKKEFEKKELQAKMQRDFDKRQALQQIEKEKEHRKNTVRQILLIAFLLAFVTIATAFYMAYKREQKRKNIVHMQKEEIENTLSELKSTQAQLIHSEKMASLGELTAGIAHEIQNPLNFVNNFSEVNAELADELKIELAKGNTPSANDIADSIKENTQKINHHGKRADSIVKGMLQHSRTSSGQKEPTDINALCDEYLRLAYHGLRAKDKTFHALLETDFDNTIGKINIVSQDIGRAILNLINNAFYAANERWRAEGKESKAVVSVSTRKTNGKILISVKDNGNGIPQKIVDKIFQPFFTTKPTGQGTGLGLSLAYDIVKAHGGEIRVETKDGEGSEFVIQLPI